MISHVDLLLLLYRGRLYPRETKSYQPYILVFTLVLATALRKDNIYARLLRRYVRLFDIIVLKRPIENVLVYTYIKLIW